MKTENWMRATWDDVVFENRNKAYGAYVIRRNYAQNSMIAFGVSVSLAILLIFLPQILSSITGRKIELPKVIPTGPITPIPQPPIIKIETPKTVEPPPAESMSKIIPPQVVTHETIEVIPPNAELLSTTTNDLDGTTFIESTATGTAVEEPPIVTTPVGPIDIAEVMPAYKGGREGMMKFLGRNLRFPKSASAVGTEGTVFVSFVIDANGRVTDVKVVKGIGADCDKEAMRVISKMTEWTAGMQNRIPVAVRMVLPIKFQILS